MDPVDLNKDSVPVLNESLNKDERVADEALEQFESDNNACINNDNLEEFKMEEPLFSADKLKELMSSVQQKFDMEHREDGLEGNSSSEGPVGVNYKEQFKFDATMFNQLMPPYVNIEQQANLEAAIRALEIPTSSEAAIQNLTDSIVDSEITSDMNSNTVNENDDMLSNQIVDGHDGANQQNGNLLNANKVFDYITRFEIGEEKGKQKCNLCEKTYVKSTSATTLSRHLLKVHGIATVNSKTSSTNSPNSSSNISVPTSKQNAISKHFSIVSEGEDKGKHRCNLCGTTYAPASSATILLRHIRLAHSINKRKETSLQPAPLQNIAPYPTDNKDGDNPIEKSDFIFQPKEKQGRKDKSKEFPSNIWSHFNIVKGKDRSWNDVMVKRCNHCHRSYSVTTSNTSLARHLTVAHGMVLPSYSFNIKRLNLDPDNLDGLCDLKTTTNTNTAKSIKLDSENTSKSEIIVKPILAPLPINHELEMSCRLNLLCKWILSNPDPAAILNSVHFQNLIFYLDPKLKLPDLETCKTFAQTLQEYRNLHLPTKINSAKSSLHCLFHRKNEVKICVYCHTEFPITATLNVISKHLLLHHHDRCNNTSDIHTSIPPSQLNCLRHAAIQFLAHELRPSSIFEQEMFKKYLVFNQVPNDTFAYNRLEEIVDRQYNSLQSRWEFLISTALTQFSVVVDLFNISGTSLFIGISLCFVDSDWKPRKLLVLCKQIESQLDTVSCELVAEITIHAIEKFDAYHPKLNGLVINAGTRGETFGSYLESRINSKFTSDCWTLNCMSKLVDDAILFTLLDHPVVLSLRKAASSVVQESSQLLSEDSALCRVLTQRDWRDLVNCILPERTSLLAEISTKLEPIAKSDWDDLDKYLERIGTVLKSATAFHSSPYLNLSEAHVVFMGLAYQLQNLAGKFCPRVARLVEYISKRHPESTGRQVVVSILLDPRFKFQAFGDSVNQEAVLGRLRELFVSFTLSRLRHQSTNSQNSRTTPATIGASLLAHRLNVDKNVTPTLNDEMDLYLKTPPISPSMDPFKWWYTHQYEYPVLHRVAMEHLALPATGNLLLTQQSTLTLPKNQHNLKDLHKVWAIGHLN